MVTGSVEKLDALRKLGRYDDLEALASELIASNPGHLAAWFCLALSRAERDDVPGALTAIATAIRLGPDRYQSWLVHSNLLVRQGRNREAVSGAREAVRLAPDRFQAHVNLAKVLREDTGTMPDAVAAAAHAVSLAPLEAETHLMVADLAHRGGDLDAAEAALREALRLEPNQAHLHDNLAIVRLNRQRVKAGFDAASGFAEALALSPEDGGVHRKLVLTVYALAITSWRWAGLCLMLGLVAAVLLFNVMLGGGGDFASGVHWTIAAGTSVLVAAPAVFVGWRLLRRVPARLRRGLWRIGLAPASTRIRLAGSLLAIAVAVTQPLVPQFPIVLGGVAVLVGSTVAARLVGHPRELRAGAGA